MCTYAKALVGLTAGCLDTAPAALSLQFSSTIYLNAVAMTYPLW